MQCLVNLMEMDGVDLSGTQCDLVIGIFWFTQNMEKMVDFIFISLIVL